MGAFEDLDKRGGQVHGRAPIDDNKMGVGPYVYLATNDNGLTE